MPRPRLFYFPLDPELAWTVQVQDGFDPHPAVDRGISSACPASFRTIPGPMTEAFRMVRCVKSRATLRSVDRANPECSTESSPRSLAKLLRI